MNQGKLKPVTPFQIFILIISFYVLIALIIQTVFTLSPNTLSLLDNIDSLICIIFIYDFFNRLYRSKSTIKFLKWNWIDLISSIPTLEIFRWGRVFRIIRILRILRAFRSTKVIVNFLYDKRSNGTFATVSMISFILMIFSSIAMLNLETSPDSNIKSPADALWWAFVTITTVGYGDKYPITVEGRFVAAILMIAGVGLFGTLSGYIASYFLEADNDARDEKKLSEYEELRTELKFIKAKLNSIESSLSKNNDISEISIPESENK